MSTQLPASAVRSRILAGVLGMLCFADTNNAIATGLNSAPQAYEVHTITVAGSPTSSHDFTVTINGIDVTYTSDGSATSQEVVDGLTEAINTSPGVRASVAAVATSSTVVTVTAIWPGQSFTMTDADSDLTCATSTSAASADEVPFGRLVATDGTFDDNLLVPKVFLPKSTNLAAQVDTLAVTYAASEVYVISITVAGETYRADVDANTNTATTAGDVVTAINAMMPANTVLAANPSGGTVTLTAEINGQAYKTAVSVKSETGSRLTLTHTTATLVTDIERCLVGIAVLGTDNAATTIAGGTTAYAANAGVAFAKVATVWVASTESVTPASDVYVETSGSNAGLFYTSGGSTRIKLSSKFRWGRAQAADGIAQLSINA